MSQIDASIPLGVKPLQMPDQMNALARIMQIQGIQQQNALGQMKMDEHKRGVEDQNALRSALSAPGADPYSVLLRRGMVKEAGDWRKSDLDAKKLAADAKKIDFDTELKKIEHVSSILSTAKDPQSYQQARMVIAQNFGEKAAANLPEQFDPRILEATIAQGQTITQRLTDMRQREQQAETGRHHRATEGLTASGQQITIRGQNMTDSRARDFNATKVEENNIKRDEKRAVADLTKSSQVASFDTMLGTLDRLASHAGLSRSVGVMGALPTMPGSNSANFQAELNTFQSQAFIPMVAQLKGMGALSDAEGKKLTAAVGALDPKMGEQAFRESVARITQDMEAARARVTGGERRPPGQAEAKPATSAKKIADDAEYNALPSGAVFVGPDGKQRRKP